MKKEDNFTFTKIKIQKYETWANLIKNNKSTLSLIISLFIIWIMGLMALPLIIPDDTLKTENKTVNLEQYPTIYSYGENLKEIYTNPIVGVYVYLCTKNSTNKSNVNLFNGIYYEKPTAKVNNNTVQNIFIFDTFPDLGKFKNISDYETLINIIIAQKPIMGFHRCFVKVLNEYYNQAFTYDKNTKQYIFYDGAHGIWTAQSSSNKEFMVQDSSEYTGGMWEYKEKSEDKVPNIKQVTSQNNLSTLENSPQLQAQYKAEIEKTINIEAIKAKKEIDRIYNEADNIYRDILSLNVYNNETFDKYEVYSRLIEEPLFGVYIKLIEITKKYTNLKDIPATDFYGALANYIEPVMKNYHIANMSKLTELEKYMVTKSNEIETRLEGIRKAVYEKN